MPKSYLILQNISDYIIFEIDGKNLVLKGNGLSTAATFIANGGAITFNKNNHQPLPQDQEWFNAYKEVSESEREKVSKQIKDLAKS